MKEYLTTKEVAEILEISVVAVFKRIKSGKLKAKKIGRIYAVDPADIGLPGGEPSKREKAEIKKAVHKAFKEYGDALKRLGDA